MRGFVYFLESEYGVKIGRSKNPVKRLNHFGVTLPFEWKVRFCIEVTDCVAAESYYHKLHASRRLKGEWFRGPVEELVILPRAGVVGWKVYSEADALKQPSLSSQNSRSRLRSGKRRRPRGGPKKVRTKRWTLIGSIWRAYRPDQMDYFSDKNGVKGSWLGGVRQVSNDPENRWYYITLANGTPMNSGEHGVWFSNWHEAERFLWPHLETYFK